MLDLINVISSSFCDSESGLRIIALIGIVLNIIRIVVPIILILLGSIDLIKGMMSDDNAMKKNQTKIIKRFILGICIFFVYPVILFVMTMINNNLDNNKCINCLTNSNECLDEANKLKEKISKEREEKLEAKKLKLKEEQEEKIEKYNKLLKKMEEYKEKLSVEQTVHASGNNINSGRSLVVENGTFYLPDLRATSDEHIPKGTGEYGLNQEFWNMLSRLINDARSLGHRVVVTSGWRSFSDQNYLWKNSANRCNPAWVSCPGGSRHGFGIAADLSYNGTSCGGGWNCNAAATWVHNNAANYGLNFRLSNEPWHIEPLNIVGGNFGACTAPC